MSIAPSLSAMQNKPKQSQFLGPGCLAAICSVGHGEGAVPPQNAVAYGTTGAAPRTCPLAGERVDSLKKEK